jgi:hypothetical protein
VFYLLVFIIIRDQPLTPVVPRHRLVEIDDQLRSPLGDQPFD